MEKYKYFKTIFLGLGIGCLIFFFDTIVTKKNEEFSFLSIPITKEISLLIYLSLATILIIAGLKFKSK